MVAASALFSARMQQLAGGDRVCVGCVDPRDGLALG